MIELNLELAQSLVEQAIAERGKDYVYEKEEGFCRYVHGIETQYDEWGVGRESRSNATPGCLVGVALHAAGVPLKELADLNDSDSGALLEHLGERGILTATDDANYYLYVLQGAQDGGTPWGQADINARKRVNDVNS